MGSIEPIESTRAGEDLGRYLRKQVMEEAEIQYASGGRDPEILPYVKVKPGVSGYSHAKN
jgi:hypothetical protein